MKMLLLCLLITLSPLSLALNVLSEAEVRQLLERYKDPVNISYTEILNTLDRLEPYIGQYSTATQHLFIRHYCWNQVLDSLEDYIAYADTQLAKLSMSNDIITKLSLETCKAYFLDLSGESTSGLQLITSVIERALPIFDAQLKADAFAVRGSMYSYQGEIAKALVDFKQAQLFYEQASAQFFIHTNRAEIARALRRMGDYDGAILHLESLINYYQNSADKPMLANTQLDMGILFLDKTDYESAIDWFGRSIQTMDSYVESNIVVDEERVDAWAYFYRAEAMASLGNAEQAIADQQRAIQLNPYFMEPSLRVEMQTLQGKIERAQGNYQQAENNLRAALEAYQQQQNYRLQIYIYKALVDLLASQGSYEQAYYLRKEQEQSEHLYQQQLDKQASELFKIELDIAARDAKLTRLLLERELDTNALEAAQKTRHLQLIIILLAFALVLSLAMYAWFKRKQTLVLSELASTDALTGFSNRRSIDDYSELLYSQAAQQLQPVSCILFDIDHFKEVNDTYGHDIGDLAIQKISAVANQFLRQKDKLARYGGEEFLIILPEANLAAASQVAERIRAGIEALNLDNIMPGLAITISLGVAERLDSELTPSGTVRRADIALYEAKKNGRNQVRLANA